MNNINQVSSPRNQEKEPLGSWLTFLMFLIASMASWATYKQFALGLTYVTIVIWICLASFTLSILLGSKVRNFKRHDLWLFVLWMIASASFIWTLSPDSWALNLYWYSLCFLTYYLARYILRTKKQNLLIGLGLIIGILLSFAMLDEQQNEYGLVLDRKSVEGLNSNFTAYVIVGSWYLLSIIHHKYRLSNKAGLIVSLFWAISFYVVYELGTRGASISLIAMGAWVIVYRFFPRWIHKYIFVTTIFIALLMTLGFFQSFLVDIDLASSRSTGDLSGRLDFWNIAINYIAEHPIAGIGIGSFTVLNPYSVGAHNIMLTLALDLGIIGAAIFIWFLFLLLYPGIKSKSTMANRYIAGLFMAYWTPIAFSGHIELSPFSWLVLAITHNLIREEVN